MKGRDQGRKSELEVAKGSTPLPPSPKPPRTLRDIGRDLGFMPFTGQGFEQNSFVSQELWVLQKVGGPCKGHERQGWGNAERNCLEGSQHTKVNYDAKIMSNIYFPLLLVYILILL